MNTRIQELIVKSNGYWEHGDHNMPSTVCFQEEDLKKFAELIVRECLDIVEKQLGGGNGDGVEWDRAIDFTYEDMKKHFGVEL